MAVVPCPDIVLGTALQKFPVQGVCKAEVYKALTPLGEECSLADTEWMP